MRPFRIKLIHRRTFGVLETVRDTHVYARSNNYDKTTTLSPTSPVLTSPVLTSSVRCAATGRQRAESPPLDADLPSRPPSSPFLSVVLSPTWLVS